MRCSSQEAASTFHSVKLTASPENPRASDTGRDRPPLCYNLPFCERAQTSQALLRLGKCARCRLPILHAARRRTPATEWLRAKSAGRPRRSLRHRPGGPACQTPLRSRPRPLGRHRQRSERRARRHRFESRIWFCHYVLKRGAPRMDELKKLIREVPDYPKPGILFYDLTTLLKDKKGFHSLIDRLCQHYNGHPIDVVAGIEARGFIFAPALAYSLGAGFVPVRKPKKLPAKTSSVSDALEYGTDTLEIHEDAVKKGDRVIICDDLLATGGTAAATVKLVQQLGGTVEGAAFAVELTFLNGRKKLPGLDVFSLIQYDK